MGTPSVIKKWAAGAAHGWVLLVVQTIQSVQQFLRHRHPAGAAQALGPDMLGTFAAAALCGTLHCLRRGLLAGGGRRGKADGGRDPGMTRRPCPRKRNQKV